MQYGESNPDPARWRIMMEGVAEANWGLLSRHRWLLDVDTTRSPLGPGTIAQSTTPSCAHALTDTGLDDVDIDLALGLLLERVTSSARQAFAAEALTAETAERSHSDWWNQAGSLHASHTNPDK